MQTITCPHCEYPNELANFVPQPGSDAEPLTCDQCEQTFTFRLDQIVDASIVAFPPMSHPVSDTIRGPFLHSNTQQQGVG